jgi:gamma-glutamylcyclotransferase (GGCT)/AIG2-like uncharacterized protein YtfP
MYYFAYGPDISREQMGERCPGSKPKLTAVLPGYRLVFTGWSRKWRGGVASIQRYAGGKVKGVVYEVTEECLRRLDRLKAGHNRLNVIVFDEDGTAMEAVTYIYGGRIEESEPSRQYAELIYRGYREWGIA